MNLEIQKPELVQRLNAHIRAGRFHDADELLEKALDALDEKSPPPAAPPGSLHEFLMNSPLRGANLDLERVRDYPRAVNLEREGISSILMLFRSTTTNNCLIRVW